MWGPLVLSKLVYMVYVAPSRYSYNYPINPSEIAVTTINPNVSYCSYLFAPTCCDEFIMWGPTACTSATTGPSVD